MSANNKAAWFSWLEIGFESSSRRRERDGRKQAPKWERVALQDEVALGLNGLLFSVHVYVYQLPFLALLRRAFLQEKGEGAALELRCVASPCDGFSVAEHQPWSHCNSSQDARS